MSATAAGARNAWPLPAAAAAGAGTLIAFFPGVASFDAVFVYAQLRRGIVTDWHPPVLARLWQGFEAVGLAGTAPLFTMQTALIWFGLGSLATVLARAGRQGAAAAMLAIGVVPPVLAWTCVVWKDAQMVAALVAATGLATVAHGHRRPAPWLVGAAAMLGYATLLRVNAIFAAAPLAVLVGRSGRGRIGVVAAIVLLAAASPVLNRVVFQAAPAHAVRSQMLFDLAGIDTARALRWPRGCYAPYGWDGFSQVPACRPTWEAARRRPLGGAWGWAIAAHPLAYVAHRAAHLIATWRFLVPPGEPRSDGQAASTPNPWRIGAERGPARTLQKVQRAIARTPIGWPFAWIGVAVTLLAASAGIVGGTVGTARALLASALLLEASFAVASVASDLRYHLWTTLAVSMAACLLAGAPLGAGRLRRGAAIVVLLCAAAEIARLTMTPDWPAYLG